LAWELTTQWVARYEGATGFPIPLEDKANLERLADYFLSLHQLERSLGLVNWKPFTRDPNCGHVAIADFLACGAVQCAVTTNVDILVEVAASQLGEPFFRSALDGAQANDKQPHKPYLKLHGCIQKDLSRTVWTPKQITGELSVEVIKERITSSKNWLQGVLQGRDLVIIGFWTDWEYLNSALTEALQGSYPATVTVVDMLGEEKLREKAPGLWQWCHQDHIDFQLERQSGELFLQELRDKFSRTFLDRLYQEVAGPGQADLVLTPGELKSEDLYDRRRDAAGISTDNAVRDRVPQPHMNAVARVHLELMRKGATIEGSLYRFKDRTLRVVNGAGDLKSRVRARYAQDTRAYCDVVVCAGAEIDPTPSDLVRNPEARDIIRPRLGGQWFTHVEGQEADII
jgi:hypothetical protein